MSNKSHLGHIYAAVAGTVFLMGGAVMGPAIYDRHYGLKDPEGAFIVAPNGEVMMADGSGRINYASQSIVTSAGGEWLVTGTVPKLFNSISFSDLKLDKRLELDEIQMKACALAVHRSGYADVCTNLRPSVTPQAARDTTCFKDEAYPGQCFRKYVVE